MLADGWAGFHSEAFERVWNAMNKHGLLRPAKLQWLQDEDFKVIIRTALKEDPTYDEDLDLEESLRNWLRGESEAAKITQLAEEPLALREWALDRYAYGIEAEKRKKARLGEAAIVRRPRRPR